MNQTEATRNRVLKQIRDATEDLSSYGAEYDARYSMAAQLIYQIHNVLWFDSYAGGLEAYLRQFERVVNTTPEKGKTDEPN